MAIIKLECPNCHAAEPEPLGDDRYRCSHCATLFVYESDRPAAAAAPRVELSSRPSSPIAKRVAVALAVVAALVVGAVFAYLKTRQGAHPARGSRQRGSIAKSVAAPPISRSQAEAPPQPKAELREIASARLARGSAIWLATLANVGEVPIERPAVLVSLFDAKGRRVAERRGWAPIELLGPGKSSPVLVLITKPPRHARAEVQPSNIEAAGAHPPAMAKLRVVEQTVRSYLRSHRKIVGTVRNEGKQPARFVRIVATGRDAAGKLVSFASAYATRTTIEPGGDSGFELTSGTFDIRPPARYEVFAVGRQ